MLRSKVTFPSSFGRARMKGNSLLQSLREDQTSKAKLTHLQLHSGHKTSQRQTSDYSSHTLLARQTALCFNAWPMSSDGPLGSCIKEQQLQEDPIDPMLMMVEQGSGLLTCGKNDTYKKQAGRQKIHKDASSLLLSGRLATTKRTEQHVRSGVLFQSSALLFSPPQMPGVLSSSSV